jgi:uncharacterized protein (TIGR03382 family)
MKTFFGYAFTFLALLFLVDLAIRVAGTGWAILYGLGVLVLALLLARRSA